MKREGLGERKKFAQMGGWSLPDWVRSALTHIVVLLGYQVLTGLFTYPLYFRSSREIIGLGDRLDVWQNYWNLWWVKTALLDLRANPFRTSLLYHPFGASLYFHTLNLSNCLLSLPLRLLFGPIEAYNSIVVVSFVLTGYFSFLLFDYLVSNKPIAFVSGMIFTFCPFHIVAYNRTPAVGGAAVVASLHTTAAEGCLAKERWERCGCGLCSFGNLGNRLVLHILPSPLHSNGPSP